MNKAVLIVRLWNRRINIDIGCFLFGKLMSNAQQAYYWLIIIYALKLALKFGILKHLINHISVESAAGLPIINHCCLLLLLTDTTSVFQTWSIIAIIANIQSAALMVSLWISASSAPGFHWVLGLLLLLRELKRRYMVIGKVARRGDCEARE